MSSEEYRGKSPTASFREYQRGQTTKESKVEPWAGMIQREDEDLFLALSEAFRGHGSFETTNVYERLLRASATRNAARAIRQDDHATLFNFVGETGDKRDLSGVQTLRKLQDSISRPAYVAYIFGAMGNGKTDFALLLSELWRDAKTQKGYDVELASNVKTWERGETIRRYDDFLDWLEVEEGDDFEDKRRLFIFDEASSHASGYSEDAQDARRMGKLVNVIRKKMASIIIIGHTGKDVHPDIRRKATHFIKKESLKEAIISTPETDSEGKMSPETEFKLKDVPPTSEVFRTDEESRWSWGNTDREERIAKMYAMGLTQAQIGEVEDLSQNRVSEILREVEVSSA